MTAPRTHHRVHPAAASPHRESGFGSSLNRFWDRPGVKPVAWTLAVLVWIPFLFVVLMVLGINPIFTMAVTRLGTNALRVPVTLRSARVGFSGKLRLERLVIENPPEFTRFDAVAIEGLYAEVPIRSLFSKEIDIPVLTVVRPVFNLELGAGKHPSNWGVLMKNLAESLPRKNQPEGPDGEKRFIIRDLKIINPMIRYRSPMFPDGIDLDLKDVELKKVGNAPDSRSKTYIVLASILQAILTGGIKDKQLPGNVRGALKEELGAASKAFGDVFEGIK